MLLSRLSLHIRVLDTDLSEGVVCVGKARIRHNLRQHALERDLVYFLGLSGLLLLFLALALLLPAFFTTLVVILTVGCGSF